MKQTAYCRRCDEINKQTVTAWWPCTTDAAYYSVLVRCLRCYSARVIARPIDRFTKNAKESE